MTIRRTIVLEHTTEGNLRNVRTILMAQMERIEARYSKSEAHYADDAGWAALFNFLVDLDTPGYEL